MKSGSILSVFDLSGLRQWFSDLILTHSYGIDRLECKRQNAFKKVERTKATKESYGWYYMIHNSGINCNGQDEMTIILIDYLVYLGITFELY